MRGGLFILALLVVPLAMGATPHAERGDVDWKRLGEALELLNHSTSGKALLEKVGALYKLSLNGKASVQALEKLFQWDSVSRTDAVLTRHFDIHTGKESRSREVSVHLKRGQGLQDLMFDVAHELTHASVGPTWDPYDPGLTPGGYIYTALEGQGGEVDAMTMECQVGFELKAFASVSTERCARYTRATAATGRAEVDRNKVREEFYRTGQWHQKLRARLGEELNKFPLLSDMAPRLYSSTGSAPYPVALLHEYDEITQAACENSRRRIASTSSSSPDRSPASSAASEPESVDPIKASAQNFISKRCR